MKTLDDRLAEIDIRLKRKYDKLDKTLEEKLKDLKLRNTRYNKKCTDYENRLMINKKKLKR